MGFDPFGYVKQGLSKIFHTASGQNDDRVVGYNVDPNSFRNPTDVGISNALYGGVFEPFNPETNRQAPQVAHETIPRAVATPVADARPTRFDTGYIAPGLGLTAGAIAQSNQARGLQGLNLARLNAAAEGQVPSAAEKQGQIGIGQVLRNNLSLAASQRGTAANQVQDARQALDSNSDAGIQANAQAAVLRANEQATARGQFTGALDEARGQDLTGANIGLGLTGIGADVGKAQLTSDTQRSLADMTKDLGLSTAQLGSDTQTGIAKLGSDTQVDIESMKSVLNSRQLDDTKKAQYLAAALGIDTRTQEGQQALEQLRSSIWMLTEQANAGITGANAAGWKQLIGGVLSAGSTGLASGLGGGGAAPGGGPTAIPGNSIGSFGPTSAGGTTFV